jgi:cold shock CspA family protein
MNTISIGTVIEISPTGRFGFIAPDCGGLEVFYHVDEITINTWSRYDGIGVGDRVSYLTRISPYDGRRSPFVAKQIELLDDDSVTCGIDDKEEAEREAQRLVELFNVSPRELYASLYQMDRQKDQEGDEP